MLLAAPPRYGKTQLVRNMIGQIAGDSEVKIIIVDPMLDYDWARYPNALAVHPGALLKVKRLGFDDLKIPLSRLTAGDWRSLAGLGMAELAPEVLTWLARQEKGFHKEDPVRFMRLLLEGGSLPRHLEIPSKSLAAMRRMLEMNARILAQPGIGTPRINHRSLAAWLQRHQAIHLALGLQQRNIGAAALFVAKLLQALRFCPSTCGKEICPHSLTGQYGERLWIIIDEADLIFPAGIETSATEEGTFLHLKALPRSGVNIINIVQYPDRLTPVIAASCHANIYGNLAALDRHGSQFWEKKTGFLRFNPNLGIRQFVYEARGGPSIAFHPELPATLTPADLAAPQEKGLNTSDPYLASFA